MMNFTDAFITLSYINVVSYVTYVRCLAGRNKISKYLQIKNLYGIFVYIIELGYRIQSLSFTILVKTFKKFQFCRDAAIPFNRICKLAYNQLGALLVSSKMFL